MQTFTQKRNQPEKFEEELYFAPWCSSAEVPEVWSWTSGFLGVKTPLQIAMVSQEVSQSVSQSVTKKFETCSIQIS